MIAVVVYPPQYSRPIYIEATVPPIADRVIDKVETPIWDEYKAIIKKYDDRGADTVGHVERYAFYDEAKKDINS